MLIPQQTPSLFRWLPFPLLGKTELQKRANEGTKSLKINEISKIQIIDFQRQNLTLFRILGQITFTYE
jgi:hypothetical protein